MKHESSDSKKVRTLRQFIFSLRNAFWRLIVYLDTIGLRLPGLNRARLELEPETVAYFERKKIIRSLRSARYQTQWGPHWFRPINDSIVNLWEQNRFWVNFFIKLLSGTLVVLIPFAIFFLIRGVLPVPNRVPINLKPNNGALKQGFFATYQPFVSTEGQADVTTMGALPRKSVSAETFALSQNRAIKLFASRAYRPSVSGRSFLRLELHPETRFLEQDSESCEFILKNELAEELFKGLVTKEASRGRIASGLRRLFQSRFTPQFDSLETHPVRITVDTVRFPSQLVATIRSLAKTPAPNSCAFNVTSPSFQLEETYPRKASGVLLVVAEGLGVSENIPQDWGGQLFQNHRVWHAERKSSLNDLLDMNSSETLAEKFKTNGYATFYAGEVYRNDLNTKGFGRVIGLETSEYNARHTTEEFSQWLSELSGSGYFATLKYDLLSPPYRPPFSEINLWSLFTNPFGLKRERSLRTGSERALVAELDNLKRHLISQGRWEDSLVILTSNAPLNLYERQWLQDQQNLNSSQSAARTFAPTTWEVDTRVPLIWKAPSDAKDSNENLGTSEANLTPISFPTSHLDLAKILTLKVFSDADELAKIWPQRSTLPLVGEDEIAILNFENNNNAQKYVFPFRPQKITVTSKKFPYRETKVIAPQERVTKIGANMSETPLDGLSSDRIETLRRALIDDHFERGTPIKYATDLTSVFIDQEYAGTNPLAFSWDDLPDGLQITALTPAEGESKVWKHRWQIKGTLQPHSRLEFFWKETEIKFFRSNLPWANLCGGTWKVNWSTLLELSRAAHPCLLQEDRIRDLLDFKKLTSLGNDAILVSAFHN